MKRPEVSHVQELLVEAVTALCRDGLHYSSKLKVEGLIGVTLDEADIVLINLNRTIDTHPQGTHTSKKATGSDLEAVSAAGDVIQDASSDACPPAKRAKQYPRHVSVKTAGKDKGLHIDDHQHRENDSKQSFQLNSVTVSARLGPHREKSSDSESVSKSAGNTPGRTHKEPHESVSNNMPIIHKLLETTDKNNISGPEESPTSETEDADGMVGTQEGILLCDAQAENDLPVTTVEVYDVSTIHVPSKTEEGGSPDQMDDHTTIVVTPYIEPRKRNRRSCTFLQETPRPEQEDEYRCVECDKVFVTDAAYRRHMKSIHLNVKLSCPYCNHLSARRDNLFIHVRRLHREKYDTFRTEHERRKRSIQEIRLAVESN